MVLRKGFFLIELMVALSILLIFILYFSRFSYISLQIHKSTLKRLKMINSLILTTENGKIKSQKGLKFRQKRYEIKLGKDKHFNFRLCECETTINKNDSINKKQKISFVVPC